MIRNPAVSLVLLLAACAPVNRQPTPSYVSEWPNVVQRASLAADSGKYVNADRILTTYASQYPHAREAHEVLFWRGLFKLDPGNTAASTSEGVGLLDRYVADTATIAHRPEATILKRLAVTTQALQAKAATASARDTAVTRASNDAEVSALKAELAKTKEELDRIKKRLANPNK